MEILKTIIPHMHGERIFRNVNSERMNNLEIIRMPFQVILQIEKLEYQNNEF